VIKLLINISN